LASDVAVDLAEFSDSELLELMVPSQSISRRLLVVWLFLQEEASIPIREFDKLLPSLAEAELRNRAAKVDVTAQKLKEAAGIFKKLERK
jgi:nucleotide-binding universal stress UspA family protein